MATKKYLSLEGLSEYDRLIKGKIDDVQTAVDTEKSRAEGVENDLKNRLDTVEGDYLKASDKAELQTQINTIMNNPDTEGVINSINEFTQYITDHGEIAEGFRQDIDNINLELDETAKKEYFDYSDDNGAKIKTSLNSNTYLSDGVLYNNGDISSYTIKSAGSEGQVFFEIGTNGTLYYTFKPNSTEDDIEKQVAFTDDIPTGTLASKDKVAKADLDAALAAAIDDKLIGIDAADASITIGDTSTAPSVAVKLSADENNALTLANDGLKVIIPESTKVEASTTNGKIIVDGNEVTVYTLPDTLSLEDIGANEASFGESDNVLIGTNGITIDGKKVVTEEYVDEAVAQFEEITTTEINALFATSTT